MSLVEDLLIRTHRPDSVTRNRRALPSLVLTGHANDESCMLNQDWLDLREAQATDAEAVDEHQRIRSARDDAFVMLPP